MNHPTAAALNTTMGRYRLKQETEFSVFSPDSLVLLNQLVYLFFYKPFSELSRLILGGIKVSWYTWYIYARVWARSISVKQGLSK